MKQLQLLWIAPTLVCCFVGLAGCISLLLDDQQTINRPSRSSVPTDVEGIVTADRLHALYSNKDYQQRRLQAGCPLAYNTTGAATGPLQMGLERSFVELMNLTLAFQYLMLQRDTTDNETVIQQFDLEYYHYWQDPDDATLIAKQHNSSVCHVSFRATINAVDIPDNWQNANPLCIPVKGSDCKVRMGFYEGVYTDYLDHLTQAMDECRELCVGTPCPLVFSGLSQGGGIAAIAAITLRAYNPLVVTLGGMRAIAGEKLFFPCHDLDSSRHFRFTTTNAAGEYDGIANQPWPLDNIQVGHSILLDDTNYPLAYVGLDEDVIRWPWNMDIHYRDAYRDRINQMLAFPDACYPIPVSKWPVGHVCGYNDECEGNNCIDGQCAAGRRNEGEGCWEDEDCVSGNCQRKILLFWKPGKCQ